MRLLDVIYTKCPWHSLFSEHLPDGEVVLLESTKCQEESVSLSKPGTLPRARMQEIQAGDRILGIWRNGKIEFTTCGAESGVIPPFYRTAVNWRILQ